VINAMVPLANMFGYVQQLRSMSQGAPPSPCSSITTNRFPRAVAAEIQAKFA